MSAANLTYDTKVTRVLNAVVAGTTDQTGTSVDMQGFAGVRFVAAFGTLTATQVTSLYAEGSADNSNWSALANTRVGPLADGDSNKLLVLDIYRPTHRYIRPVVDRGTANAVIDGVVAEQYGPRKAPITKDATVAFQEIHASPAAGTA